MRMPDPPWARLTRPTLAARRARARLARLAAVCCVVTAAAIVAALLNSLVATTDVVVASHGLRRGDVIGADDVTVVVAPHSPVVARAFSQVEDVVGRIAQNDVEPSQPLFPTNARDVPVVPSGRTVLQVGVSNDVSTLVAGDTVRLVSAVGCDTGADGGMADESTDASSCTLADEALVMARARHDGAASVVTMAMAPEAAVRVMASAELGAIVAVIR